MWELKPAWAVCVCGDSLSQKEMFLFFWDKILLFGPGWQDLLSSQFSLQTEFQVCVTMSISDTDS